MLMVHEHTLFSLYRLVNNQEVKKLMRFSDRNPIRATSSDRWMLSHSSWLLSRYRTKNTKHEKFTSRPAQNTKNDQNRFNNGGER